MRFFEDLGLQDRDLAVEKKKENFLANGRDTAGSGSTRAKNVG